MSVSSNGAGGATEAAREIETRFGLGLTLPDRASTLLDLDTTPLERSPFPDSRNSDPGVCASEGEIGAFGFRGPISTVLVNSCTDLGLIPPENLLLGEPGLPLPLVHFPAGRAIGGGDGIGDM